MRLWPWHLCAVALLAGTGERARADAAPAHSVAGAADEDLAYRGAGEHAAALARTVRATRKIREPEREGLASLLDRIERWERGGHMGSPPTRSEIAAAFDAWDATARRLPPARHGDALLTADRAMDAMGNAIGGGPDSLERLQLGGAEFHPGLGGGWLYAHTFLREAQRVAPRGSPRDRVLLRAMEIAFDYDGRCSAGDDVTAKVIASGEALLRRARDPRFRAAAHLMIADAYASIVVVATGEMADYFDTDAYRRREKAARRDAIVHYRAGFALDPDPPDAELMRRDLQRLVDGAAPGLYGWSRRRFFCCVYD